MNRFFYRSFIYFLIGFIGLSNSALSAALSQKLISPDGNLVCHLLIENDQLFLSVTKGAIKVLEKSPSSYVS
jgi:hypothetical protein